MTGRGIHAFVLALMLVPIAGRGETAHEAELVVHNQVVAQVNPLLFGQFLERNAGEHGPESALVPGTSQLRPDVLAKLKSMDIPVVRFPGGTDIDFTDWRDMIDNVPGREGGRPVTTVRYHEAKSITNAFGYTEYFTQLRDPLKWQTDVVVNFLDAVAKRKPMHEAAIDSCGLLAYLNAPQGAKLPKGMPDWPAVRAKNGRPAPYAVEYVQIGNETWIPNFSDVVRKALPGKTDDELAAHYLACLKEYIAMIRQIDPAVKIVIDLRLPFGAAKVIYANPYVLKNVALMDYHLYQDGTLSKVKLLDKTYPSTKISPDDLWSYWSMIPGWAREGESDFIPRDEPGLKAGLKIAVAEWNWRGWGALDDRKAFDPVSASSLGTARTLHSLIRASDRVGFATQSMLVGAGWKFAAIVFEKEVPDSAHFSAQGQTTDFYRHTIGSELLKTEMTKGLETLRVHVPDFKETMPAGAVVDALASRDKNRIRVHVINRFRDGPLTFSVRLEGFGSLGVGEPLRGLIAKGDATPNDDPLTIINNPVTLIGSSATVLLPKPGVYLIEFQAAAK